MELSPGLQFTQELCSQTQNIEREQVGFLGIEGKTFPIYDGPNKIGRDPETCDIVLNNATLSRQHAVINILTTRGQKEMLLMDLGSRNKTKIGIKTLQCYLPHPLKDGDTIQVGEALGVYRVLHHGDCLPATQQADLLTQEMSTSPPPYESSDRKLKNNVIVPESPDVSDKDDSLIFKSPMIMSKKTISQIHKANNLKSKTKTLSQKLNEVATTNSFLNNTTKNMISDDSGNKSRLSDESFKSIDTSSNQNSDSSNKSIDSTNKSIDSTNKSIERMSIDSNLSVDGLYEANTQLPIAISHSIHSLDTQMPSDANESGNFDLETEKKAFEDSLLNENDDIHIASTQIILNNKVKLVNSKISDINNAETQVFNNVDVNINEEATQVFGLAVNGYVSALETQVFGDNDISKEETQAFPIKDIENEFSAKNKTDRNINNIETQLFDNRDEEFCALNTQLLDTDVIDAPIETKETVDNKTDESPDILFDNSELEHDLSTQILEITKPKSPEASKTIETNKTTESTKENNSVQESDEEITFDALNENDCDINMSQNILGDSEPIINEPSNVKDIFIIPNKHITPKKKKPKAKEIKDQIDNSELCTQIVKNTSPLPFEEDEVLTQCDVPFDDMATQVLIEELPLPEVKRIEITSFTNENLNVASLSKKNSANTSTELENSLSFVSPRKLISMDLPNSQEIVMNVKTSSDNEDNVMSDSEQEPNTQENTPILFKARPKTTKQVKNRANEVKKSLDFTEFELPTRVLTRVRKPTAKLNDADPVSKIKAEKILKPKISDEIDTDIISENITRLKTKKEQGDSTVTEPEKIDVKIVKAKSENVKKDKETKSKNITVKQSVKEEPKSYYRSSKRLSNEETNVKDKSKTSSDKVNANKSKKTNEVDSKVNNAIKSEIHSKIDSLSNEIKSKDTKSNKRRSNSVSSDEVEPKKKRTRLDHKTDTEASKIIVKKESKSNIKSESTNKANKANKSSKKDDKNKDKDAKTTQIDKNTDKIDITIDKIDKVRTRAVKKQDEIDKKEPKTTKKEQKLVGILKHTSQIDKYLVKTEQPITGDKVELRKRGKVIDLTENVDVKKRKCDSDRTTRRGKDKGSCYKILFTAFNNEEVKKKLEELGASIVTETRDCDVLVTVQIKRTFKLLCAVGLGKPIVGPRWVQSCVDSGRLVDPWQYLLEDEATETKYNFNLKTTLRGKRNFLRGFKVTSTPNVKPNEDEMKQIVECSGGKWGSGGRKWVAVTGSADRALWGNLRQEGATLVHAEFILHGALTQSADLIKHRLGDK